MKLTKNVHADLRGESKEVIDAMIAVAQAAGFHLVQTLKSDYKILEITFDGDIYVLNHICTLSDTSKKITVNEWLFSNAPDWTVDIRNYDNCYMYTDRVERVFFINADLILFDWAKSKEIATRETKKAHDFKVGDKYKWNGHNTVVKVFFLGDEMFCATNENNKEVAGYIDDLRPLQSKQEELMYKDLLYVYSMPMPDLARAKQLIKLGWLKE